MGAGTATRRGAFQNCFGGTRTTSPSSASVTLIWHDRAARLAHVEGEVEHVLLHLRGLARLVAPILVDVDVARRAGARAAAFGLDAGNVVELGRLHHGDARLGLDHLAAAIRLNVRDLGHEANPCAPYQEGWGRRRQQGRAGRQDVQLRWCGRSNTGRGRRIQAAAAGRDTPSRRRRNSAAASRRGERGDELPGFARCRLNGSNELRLSGRGEAGHALRLLGELRQPPRSHRPRRALQRVRGRVPSLVAASFFQSVDRVGQLRGKARAPPPRARGRPAYSARGAADRSARRRRTPLPAASRASAATCSILVRCGLCQRAAGPERATIRISPRKRCRARARALSGRPLRSLFRPKPAVSRQRELRPERASRSLLSTGRRRRKPLEPCVACFWC